MFPSKPSFLNLMTLIQKDFNFLSVTDRDNSFSYAGYQAEVEEGQTYAPVFTGLFLMIAILSVMSTMNRFVRQQRVQIGTLKALGFKNRKIYIHYIGFGFMISLVAAVLGVVVGYLTIVNSLLIWRQAILKCQISILYCCRL